MYSRRYFCQTRRGRTGQYPLEEHFQPHGLSLHPLWEFAQQVSQLDPAAVSLLNLLWLRICHVMRRLCRAQYEGGRRRTWTINISKAQNRIITQTTHSSFKNANDHPSVFFATSVAVFSSSSNKTPNPPSSLLSVELHLSVPTALTFVIHLPMYVLLSSSLGSSKWYLTSNREGRLRMASSICSGWFVVAMVRIPSFCACEGKHQWYVNCDVLWNTYQSIELIEEEWPNVRCDHWVEIFNDEDTWRTGACMFEYRTYACFRTLIYEKEQTISTWNSVRRRERKYSHNSS